MKIAIIVSTKDTAAMNIRKALMQNGFRYGQEKFEDTFVAEMKNSNHEMKMYTSQTDSINNERIDEKTDCDIIVFASRHRSAAKIPSLTVHTPGNLGEAKYGGAE